MATLAVTQSLIRLSRFSTVGLWNSQIREAINQGCAQKSIFLFRQMKQNGLEPNNYTFPFVAKACSKLSSLEYSQIVHTHIVKSSFCSHIIVQTAVVGMYIKCGALDYAYNVFERMPVKDLASWNAMLVGFAQSGFLDRVFSLFREMRFAGIKSDSVTVMGLTQSILCSKNLNLMKGVHSLGIRFGIGADVSVNNTWVAAYAKCGDLGLAEMVFDGIELGLRTIVSWNSMIAGYANFEKSFDAVNSYKYMLQDGFTPDVSSIVSLLSSCVQPEALFQGALIHSHVIQLGCDLDVAVVNTLISMYSKCGDINAARFLFDRMSDRTRVSWTAMISGYSEKGDMDEALGLFHSMEAADEKPDLVTVVSLISGCGQTGSLEPGKWIDSYASLNGLKDGIMVGNSLIDMYAKCGSISDARELFYSMPERTVVSWTTMIAGCALNGEFREALNLFLSMLKLGLKPNHITFLAVLQACTHAGFLDEGWECFDIMTKVYNINPGLDHYSCMVDLLGRRGMLKEALEFIQTMPVKPDAGIWGALLGACKIYCDIDIGEYVTHHLFELDPQAAVPYVAMANIYASAGRWDGVAMIRAMMKCNSVRKCPGQSLIQLNGKTHSFTVEDRDHPEGLLIYSLLDGLALLSKEEGYSPHLGGISEFELE